MNTKRKHNKQHSLSQFKLDIISIYKILNNYLLPTSIAIIFAIGSTLFSLFAPKILSYATNELFYGSIFKISGNGEIDFYHLFIVLCVTFVLYLLSSICDLIKGIISTSVSQKICYKLRNELIHKINILPVSYFEKNSKGDYVSRLINDVDYLGQYLTKALLNIITTFALLIGSTVMMYTINPLLATIVVVLVPISLFLVSFIISCSQHLFIKQQDRLGKVNGYIEECITGHDIIQTFNQKDNIKTKFEKLNSELYSAGLSSKNHNSLIAPIMAILNNLSYVVVVIIGAWLSIIGQFTVGDIQAFILYVHNFTSPLSGLMNAVGSVQQIAASCHRVYRFLYIPVKKDTLNNNLVINNTKPLIAFKNVNFSYKAGQKIINNFNLDVYKGQTVAIIGPTGAGKSTITKLLLRYYDPDSGSITLYKQNTKDHKRFDIRKNFSFVLQDPWLFNDTIYKNIIYGCETINEENVYKVCDYLKISNFINKLPNKYQTIVEEDSTNISYGQKQLLCLARAILAKKDILIFDEPTSSLDPVNEVLWNDAVKNIIKGKTCLMITHQLSTIKKADHIIVLKKGTIVEQGKHEQLLNNRSLYYKLYISNKFLN